MAPNDTPYAFAYDTSNPADEVPIGKGDFDLIKPSVEHVFAVQDVEDLYDMLVKAVWKFDQIFFRYADLARFENGSDESFHQKRQEINNASVEVFSILQMILDYQGDNPHVNQEPLPKLADEPSIQRCKALRNYLQHVGTFPLIISTGSTICAQTVDFSSVRFTMKQEAFDLSRLKKSTKKCFEAVFPTGTDIDLYEVVNRGFDAVTQFIVATRTLLFFSDEYEQCSRFLLTLSEQTWAKNKIVLRFVDDEEKAGRDWIMPYLAEKNIHRIEDLRKRYKCRPVSETYVTNAPESFLKDCNRAFFTREAREVRFAKRREAKTGGNVLSGKQAKNAKGTTP